MSSRATRFGILVGVDGSESSREALLWAMREAAMRKVPMTLVHVLDRPDERWSGWGLSSAPLPAKLARRQQDHARQVIEDAVAIIEDAEEHRPSSIAHEVLSSPVVPTLIDLSKDAAMVVVGARGRDA